MFKQTERPNKEKLVRAFFSQFNSPIKTYLCFPSLRCADIKIGMESGAINKRTKIIAIEREPAIARSISDFLISNGLNYRLFTCEAEHAIIKDVIDGAYIDVCGQITSNLVCWIHLLNFTDNAKVAFTFCKTPRSRHTYYQHILSCKFNTPRFIGRHCESDSSIEKMCGALEWALPKIRWNITRTYKDTRNSMTFIAGYYGKLSPITVRVKRPAQPQTRFAAFIEHIQRVKFPLTPQQQAGITNRFNQLSVGERAAAKRYHFNPQLKCFE